MFGCGGKQQDRLEEPVLQDDTSLVVEGEICAWCLQEQGIQSCTGSHGICLIHRDRLMQQLVERHARRRAP